VVKIEVSIMSHPSLESILSLSLEPQVGWGTIEELASDVYQRLEVAEEVLKFGSTQSARHTAAKKVRKALSSFHILRLALASYLEDYENWGDDWKRYAEQYVPAEHKVRLLIERANIQD
jgi:hypothetical protein